jgi:hypothetical protein
VYNLASGGAEFVPGGNVVDDVPALGVAPALGRD